MNKKALFFVGLCSLGLCFGEVQAYNPQTTLIINEARDLPPMYERIELHGDFDYNIGPNDIEAGANENSVYIHFNRGFGNVDIKIYNATGSLIHNSVMNTSVQQTAIIPISSNVSGTYTVVLNNANGYAEGDFERN